MKASKAGRLEHEDHKADDAPSGADDARARRETDLALVPVMGRLLGQGLKAVSLEARRDPAVPELERILSRVRPDEGLERIIHELRRSSVFAPIEGGLAIEVVPTLNPAATSLPWMDRMDESHLQRMRRWAAQDPSRILETRLPVGLAFDMMDMVPDEDFLRDSEVYTGVYDTFVDSWGAVVLHRDARATWLLTGWHRIEGLERRLKLRTSLQRLSPSLSAAFGRVGLFGVSEADPPARRNYVKGWSLLERKKMEAPRLAVPRKSARPVPSLGNWIRQYQNAPVPNGLVPAQLLAARLEQSLKRVSMAGWAGPGLDEAERDLESVHPSEGLGRIVDIVRQAPAFAALEGGHISLDEVPTADPGATRARWADALHAELSERVLAATAEDPFRELDTFIPVGSVFDIRDAVLETELRDSELFHRIYQGDLQCSCLGAIVERTAESTWTLTLWHRIEEERHRLAIRSSLSRLAKALRIACWRTGLFGDGVLVESADIHQILPSVPRTSGTGSRSQFVRGATLDPRQLTNERFTQSPSSDKVDTHNNPRILKTGEGPPLSEWTFEQLEAERTRLKEVVASTQAQIDAVEHELTARLEFADAIPVRTFSATAVKLLEGFQTDPRPIVIYVSGTDRSCILKPADPADLADEVTPVGKVGQYGSRLVQQVSEDRARGVARIGISRWGGRNKVVVAELCPPNARSVAYIAALRRLGKLE